MELIICLMIIGFISSLALPKLNKVQQFSKEKILKTILHSIQMSLENHLMIEGRLPESMTIESLTNYLVSTEHLNKVPLNPFTQGPFKNTDTSGKITYSQYNNQYELNAFGKNNKNLLLTLQR